VPAGRRIAPRAGRHLEAYAVPDGLPEAAADGGVDVVEEQVFRVHVGWLEACIAGMQDLPCRGCQGSHPEPERIASGVLARGEPLIGDVAGGPQPYLPPVMTRSFDLPLRACGRRGWLRNVVCPN